VFRPRFVLRSFSGDADPHNSGKILRVLLDGLTAINLIIMGKERDAGRSVPLLYESGIRYVRDGLSGDREYGPEDWQDCLEANYRREADCKTLACYRAAELNFRYGVKAFAQFRWRDRDVGALYHIVVQHPDGSIEDPSARLGMRRIS
jgi:hypothetical protein